MNSFSSYSSDDKITAFHSALLVFWAGITNGDFQSHCKVLEAPPRAGKHSRNVTQD